jgi:hypothetical protein
MPKFNNGEELPYLEKDDILMSGSPNSFSSLKAQNVFNRTLTRTQLQSLITASSLNIGQQYTISNSVSDTMPLKVTATAVNVLDEVAVRVSNGENYIYDIVTDVATQSSNEIVFAIADPTETSVLSYDDAGVRWINKEVNDILPQSIEVDADVEFNNLALTGNIVTNGAVNTGEECILGGNTRINGDLFIDGNAITQDGDRPITTMRQNDTNKLILGIPSTNNDIIIGDVIGDVDFRTNAQSFNFSINNGAGITFKIGANGTVTCTSNIVATRASFTSLPTSAAGLTSGDLWNDSGTVKIV